MDRESVVDSFPLSAMQAGMLVSSLTHPHAGFDVEQVVILLPEAVDDSRMAAAWRVVVARHEVLRSRLVWEGVEHPYQEVLADVAVSFRTMQESGLSDAQQRQCLQAFLVDDRTTGFVLCAAPLLRLTLLRWGPASCTLVWTYHHGLLDGWGISLILREVFEVYEELKHGSARPRPAPPSYRTHIAWLHRQELEKAGAYWAKRLDGFSASTPLVVDQASDRQDHRHGEVWAELDTETTSGLRRLADEQEVSLGSLVSAGWAILLHRYTGHSDVVFGTTRRCRGSSVSDARDVAGLFINTVPTRVRLHSSDSVLSVVMAVRRESLEVRPYEQTPLTEIKASSAIPGAGPLFETLVVFENRRIHEVLAERDEAWARRWVDLHGMPNVPLTLAAYGGKSLGLELTYDRTRMDDAAVRRLNGHLQNLLRGMVADPMEQVGAVPLLGDRERRQLLVEFGRPATELSEPDPSFDQGSTLPALFEAQTARTPDTVAVVFEGERLTYRELDQRADHLATLLVQLGVGAGSIAAVALDRSLETVVGLLGVLKTGATYLPVDTTFPRDRIAFMLADACVGVVITQRDLLPNLPTNGVQKVCLDALECPRPASTRELAMRPGPEDVVAVIYTSGSTGQPKGVCITHGNLSSYVNSAIERLRFEQGMSYATVSTIAADLGNTVIFPALVTGGTLHIISRQRSENQVLLAEYFEREGIDVLKIVPSHLAALQSGEHPERVMPKKRLVLGGEASSRAWVERLQVLAPDCQIFNHYGPTEATVGALVYCVDTPLPATGSGTVPVGRPLSNRRVYVVDEALQPVPIGVPGELCIGGAGIARGYLDRAELTAVKFVADPFVGEPSARLYRTGDRARWLADGNVEFLGRTDNQVKIRGYRVELGEIETALRELSGVLDSVVISRDDKARGKQLVAYVVAKRTPQPLWAAQTVQVLPNGVPVASLNKNETDYLYDEIFTRQAYLRHGITVGDGACVIDAGANIGLFTIFVGTLAKDVRVFAFEPNPSVFERLELNAMAAGARTTCFPVGLSRESKTAEMTFFEGFSLLSGFYADASTEGQVIRTYVLNQIPSGAAGAGAAVNELGELIEQRLHARSVTTQLRTLSSMIAQEGIEQIELLKINVEKSELDILEGISGDDWLKIRQLVVEVDRQEHVDPISNLLERYGYEYCVEQDPLLRGTDLRYVYAIRPGPRGRLARKQSLGDRLREPLLGGDEALTPASLKHRLRVRLPDHMVPDAFVLLEKLPLTANGKLDHAALPAPDPIPSDVSERYVAPVSDVERSIASLWQEVLHLERVGIHDNFFDLGGHSLLAISVHGQLRKRFNWAVSMVEPYRERRRANDVS